MKRTNECFTGNKNTISVQNRLYNGVLGNKRLIFIGFLAKIEHDACINTLRVFCLNIVRLIGFSVWFGFSRLGVLLLVYVLSFIIYLCAVDVVLRGLLGFVLLHWNLFFLSGVKQGLYLFALYRHFAGGQNKRCVGNQTVGFLYAIILAKWDKIDVASVEQVTDVFCVGTE